MGLSDDVHVVVSRYGEAVSHDCEGNYIEFGLVQFEYLEIRRKEVHVTES